MISDDSDIIWLGSVALNTTFEIVSGWSVTSLMLLSLMTRSRGLMCIDHIDLTVGLTAFIRGLQNIAFKEINPIMHPVCSSGSVCLVFSLPILIRPNDRCGDCFPLCTIETGRGSGSHKGFVCRLISVKRQNRGKTHYVRICRGVDAQLLPFALLLFVLLYLFVHIVMLLSLFD